MQQSSETANPPAQTKPSGHAVLVVDDEPAIRDLLALILNRLGYETACAADTGDAVRLCRIRHEAGRPFHAAIVDLTLPKGENGADLGRRLRAIDPGLRLILTSGFAQGQAIREHKHLGFDAALAKPFRMADVDRVLGEVLAGNAHANPPSQQAAGKAVP